MVTRLRGYASGDDGTEYPSVHAFALAPGFVPTRLTVDAQAGDAPDTVALPAATMLYLTSGRADWLSGRLVHGVKRKTFGRVYTIEQVLFLELGYSGGGA
jgi:hypothetical protein